jgi:hypothetical protein
MTARALCPVCGRYRSYSSAAAARRAEKAGKRCQPCANKKKNERPRVLGFSAAEFAAIKEAARRRGKSWSIYITDIHDLWEQQDGKCAMTGTPMNKAPRTWSIDRIDNACGYTRTNIQLVLKHVNMMRGPLDEETFVELCEAIYNHRSKHETDRPEP